MAKTDRMPVKKWVRNGLVGAVCLGVFLLIAASLKSSQEESRKEQEQKEQSEQNKNISKFEDDFRSILKDPASAQFRQVTSEIRACKSGENFITGMYNSKNSSGGYDDFHRFIYIDLGGGGAGGYPYVGIEGVDDNISNYAKPYIETYDALKQKCANIGLAIPHAP